MISAEELLKPVTDNNPCGEDLSYDPRFQELEVLIRGKEETQFSKAEPPDWKKVYARCQELLKESKDLRVVTQLCVAAAVQDGLAGVKEAFTLLREMLVRYWEPVHPRLDPEDNDPTERVNVIAGLATARGTFGDPLQFLARLREVPLTNSVQLGRFSLADIDRAKSGQPAAEGASAVGEDQIQAAFRDTAVEDLKAAHESALALIELASGIETTLTQAVGAGQAVSLDLLTNELKEIERGLAPYVGAPAVTEDDQGQGVQVSGAPAKPISGEVQSRQDVIRMLDKICAYYAQHEPSSPVPSLLRRAQRLSEKDFLAIIKDMCPDAETTVRTVTGQAADDAG